MFARKRAGLLLAAAITSLLFIAPTASALTTATAETVEAPGGEWVGKATCPEGSTVVSGGFAGPFESDAVVNRRAGKRGWLVKGQDANEALTVYAYCSRRLEPGIKSRSGRLDFEATGEGRAAARCPKGKIAVSGGWEFAETDDNQTVYTSIGDGRAWKLSAASGDSPRITAFAYCLRIRELSVRANAAHIDPNSDLSPIATRCHRGEELLGGGFKTKPKPDYDNETGPDTFVNLSRRKGERGWAVAATNYSDVGGMVTVTAMCRG